MTSTLRLAAAVLALGACPAWAQKPPVDAPAAAASAAKARAHITVIEDDNARIEESRSRGAVQHVMVHSKLGGARPYQIQVAPAGRDPSQERGNAGRRAWSLFDF